MKKNIRYKMLLAFGSVGAVLLVQLVLSLFLQAKVVRSVEHARDVGYAGNELAMEIKLDVVQVQQWLTDISATRAAEGFDDGYKEAEKYAGLFAKHLEGLRTLYPELRKDFDDVEKTFAEFYDKGKSTAEQYVKGGPASGNKAMTEFDSYAENMAKKLDTLEEEMTRGAEGAINGAMGTIKTNNIVSGFIILLIIAFTTTVALCFSARVSAALGKMVELSGRIADGDLTHTRLEMSQEDEIGQLAAALDRMTGKLRETIQDVRMAADQVAAGSHELSGTSQEVSQGASEQAASVEQISSAMEELASTVAQSADNARQTTAIASKAANDAVEGGKAVTETVSAMQHIAEKIEVIEEIARQTNLLALNAAIEAARAGEHGKGFAVVASEVRKLAERSQVSAQEIRGVASASVQTAILAGKTIEEIVPQIQKTAELVQEIDAASNEQARGIDENARAVEQFDQVIQGNSAAAEEMASTSEQLTAQAARLQEAIAYFRLSGRPGGQTDYRPSQQASLSLPASPSRSMATGLRERPVESKNNGARIALQDSSSEDFERY